MGPPVSDIEAVRLGTRRILRTVGELTDEQVAAKSLLPGWSRAELLTHLARNADGGRGIAQAAARGEVGAQYPGGAEQRAAGIAAGRGVNAAALLADLRRSCDALMEAWMQLPDGRVGRHGPFAQRSAHATRLGVVAVAQRSRCTTWISGSDTRRRSGRSRS